MIDTLIIFMLIAVGILALCLSYISFTLMLKFILLISSIALVIIIYNIKTITNIEK